MSRLFPRVSGVWAAKPCVARTTQVPKHINNQWYSPFLHPVRGDLLVGQRFLCFVLLFPLCHLVIAGSMLRIFCDRHAVRGRAELHPASLPSERLGILYVPCCTNRTTTNSAQPTRETAVWIFNEPKACWCPVFTDWEGVGSGPFLDLLDHIHVFFCTSPTLS